MRSLTQALQSHELIVLRVIGEWWELDLTGTDKRGCVKQLSQRLLGLNLLEEIEYLPPEEAEALNDVVVAGGRVPVAAFERQHGELRLMGPGKLEREEPWLDPVSATEALWYRGLVYRAFDETADGTIEFYYMPTELFAKFPPLTQPVKVVKEVAQIQVASVLQAAAAPKKVETAVSDAVDDLTTLLALAQKTSLQADKLDQLDALLLNPDRDRRSLLITLANEMGMVKQNDEGLRPTKQAVSWLKQPRESQLRALADAWSQSAWNELRHTPGLQCDGDHWQNDPILARTALLDAAPHRGEWYRLADLVTSIKLNDPDFQRPDGDYDTWYIRDLGSDSYLTGFESWELVEGKLLRFLAQGPLTWLGLVETAESTPGDLLYHLTDRALAWLNNETVVENDIHVPMVVQTDGSLIVPYNADRYYRFQAARISEADSVEGGKPFRYRLTPLALGDAKEQGIPPERIVQFLEEASGRPIPPGIKRAISRWSEKGVEGRLETAVILRVRDATILETLRANPKTRDYLGETLGDLAVVVRQPQKLREATAQLGLLLDVGG